MGDDVRNAAGAELDTLHLAKLVLSLLSGDAVDGEAALDVVEETEVLAGLVDGDDIHEAAGVGVVSSDLAVDLDQSLHDDLGDLLAGQSILQTVLEEDLWRKKFLMSVGSFFSAYKAWCSYLR